MQISGESGSEDSYSDAQLTSAWERHLQEFPDSWNGPLMRFVRANSQELVLAEADYRQYVAAREFNDPSGDVFVAVTGLLMVGDAIVLGLRSEGLRDAGTWEFAPAGSLETLPIEEQLDREIREELNLSPEIVNIGPPIGIHINRERHVADVITPVRVSVTAQEIQECFIAGEYQELMFLTQRELKNLDVRSTSDDGLFRCVLGLMDQFSVA